MNKIIDTIKKNWLIKRTTTILFMAILAGLFIGITLFMSNLNLAPIDFTQNKLYSLTDITKEKIRTVEKEVKMYFIGYLDTDAVIDLAKQYSNYNNKIIVETVNINDRPDLAEKYGIENDSTGIIVECGDIVKILSQNDFYTYDSSTYEQIDITEEKLTNTILTVVTSDIPKIYFLEGYSEFSINKNMNYLTMYLSNEVTEFDSLDLLVAGNVPEDCKTLVISTPNKDFDDIAVQAIMDYISRGGNILWFNTAIAQDNNYENINKILSIYGINSFEKGYIRETDTSKAMSTDGAAILPSVNYSKATKNIPQVLMINPTKINFADEVQLEELKVTKNDLITSSEKSYFRNNFEIQTSNRNQDEQEGPFVIGAELEKIISEENFVKSKMIICGENIFISDYTLGQKSNYPVVMYSYNKDFVLDVIAYLADREIDIVIRKDTKLINYTATVEQNTIIQIIIFGVPIIIIIIGIIVWQIRRRRNGEPKIKKRKLLEEKNK